jgi:hypothetical protein
MRANREPDRTIELDREGLQIGARSVHRLLPARHARGGFRSPTRTMASPQTIYRMSSIDSGKPIVRHVPARVSASRFAKELSRLTVGASGPSARSGAARHSFRDRSIPVGCRRWRIAADMSESNECGSSP